jgi:hypothetical protein
MSSFSTIALPPKNLGQKPFGSMIFAQIFTLPSRKIPSNYQTFRTLFTATIPVIFINAKKTTIPTPIPKPVGVNLATKKLSIEIKPV